MPSGLRERLQAISTAEPSWIVRDGVLALVIGLMLLAGQAWLDSGRSARQQALDETRALRSERLENLRYVRERSAGADEDKNFAGLDLGEQDLQGLDLRGADFRGAILVGVNFSFSDLTDADLSGADVRRVEFFRADLTLADLGRTRLQGAVLHGAMLDRTDFSESDVRGAIFIDSGGRGPCYDSQGDNSVYWPGDGIEVPPARCPPGGA